MKRKPQATVAAAVAAAAIALASSAAAASIGANYVNNGTGGVQDGDADSLLPEESAGAPSYAQTHWNNLGRWGQTIGLNDSSGASSGVTVTWDSNNTWTTGSGTGTPDAKLMSGYLDATGTGSPNNEYGTGPGAYHFWWNENKPEAYVTGISTWLATQGVTKYDVVVYLDGDATEGRICECWLQSGVDGDPPTTLGSDLTSHAFLRDNANFSGTYMQVPLSANSVANAADGNYVVFTDVEADSFILRTEEKSYHGAFISGFQIVPRTSAIPPAIASQPVSSAVYAGRTVHFSASATGSPPLTYQWQKNGTNLSDGGNISGATTGTLTIGNATAADAGNYTLVVTNSGSTATSNVAALSIAAAPVPGSHAALLLTDGALAHWRLNETGDPSAGNLVASDFIGGYSGKYGSHSMPGGVGPESPALPGFESGNGAVDTTSDAVNPSWVTVPAPALNSNTVTIAGWIYPVGVQADGTGIFMARGATTAGLIFNSTDNRLGYTWNNDSEAAWGWDSNLRPPDSEWSFVVLVIEPSKATLYLGTNGSLASASNTIAHSNEAWGGPARIGSDPASIARTFSGLIDEVALFGRALSFDEVADLYETATGVPQTSPALVTAEPGSQTRYAGKTVQFSAAASGTGPVTYQWQFNDADLTNGGNVSGATTDTLTLTNVVAGNTGNYKLVVSNAFGTDTSEVAALSVVSPATAYESDIVAADPLAFWRLDETGDPALDEVANDYWGGFSGAYGTAVSNGFSGISGPTGTQGFAPFGNTNNAIQTANNAALSYVSTPALNVSTNTMTITGWVYPTGPVVNWSGLIFSRGGTLATGLNVSGNGRLGYHWNDAFWDVDSGLALPMNEWSFVAVAVQPAQATLYVYNLSNGLQAYTNVATHQVHSFSEGFRIGGDPVGDDRTFNGRVDEVAIFGSALTEAQIEDLVALPPLSLSIERSGNEVILTWPSGTLYFSEDLSGPWTPLEGVTSPLIFESVVPREFYRVQRP